MKSYNKTYLFAFIVAITIIGGCNPTMISLKGKYVSNPLELTSTKSSDSLWLDITQIFAAKGLDVKKIDKLKGLIVSEETPFISAYTFEGTDGQLKEPQAWVVLPTVFTKKKEWIPKTIYGQWSIRITETGKGITTIKVDPIVICTYYPNTFTSVEARGQSTGGLEGLMVSTMNDLK